MYLQVYEGRSKVIFTKSIDEVYTMTASAIKENVSTSGKSSTYYMALKVINTENIPDVELSSDESGLASITCTLDDDEYEYIFSKKLLVKIERKYSYRYNASNLN